MKKNIFHSGLVFLTLFSSIAFAQTESQSSTNNTSTSNFILDRYKTPASSKDAMDRQLRELEKFKDDGLKTIGSWEVLITSISKQISSPPEKTVNIGKNWIQIETELKNNANGKNNKSIVVKANEIINAFSASAPYIEYSSPGSLLSFVEAFDEKLIQAQKNVTTETGTMTLVRSLYQSITRNIDITNESRMNEILVLKKDLTDAELQNFLKSVSEIYAEEKLNAESEKEKLNKTLTQIDAYYDAIVKAKEDKDISINHEAIRWGLPLFCFTVIILFYGAFFYRKLLVKNIPGNENNNDKDHEQITKVLLEVITVLLLTMTVLILGLSRILNENVLGTLLGGIAGYILNKKQT